ncbi:MAG: hypothetical protein QNJ51_09850 [Calothrix sp. MO_167.B12]|nr:hypothetical protein [Calothrix sp. MO_167.B12]
MSQKSQATLSNKQLVKVITKTIKKNVALQGINPTTRKGNKELELLVKTISNKKSFTDLSEAREVGEKLGERIIQVSQQRGKKDLDKGVIRFLVSNGDVLTAIGFSKKAKPTSPQLSDAPAVEPDVATIYTPEPTESEPTSPQPSDAPAVEPDVAAIDTPEPIETEQTSSQPSDAPAVEPDVAAIDTPEPAETEQEKQESEIAG